MVGWHHGLDGHEFEQGLGDGEGQGNLVCCSPWGRKELDMTEQLNNSPIPSFVLAYPILLDSWYWPGSYRSRTDLR